MRRGRPAAAKRTVISLLSALLKATMQALRSAPGVAVRARPCALRGVLPRARHTLPRPHVAAIDPVTIKQDERSFQLNAGGFVMLLGANSSPGQHRSRRRGQLEILRIIALVRWA